MTITGTFAGHGLVGALGTALVHQGGPSPSRTRATTPFEPTRTVLRGGSASADHPPRNRVDHAALGGARHTTALGDHLEPTGQP